MTPPPRDDARAKATARAEKLVEDLRVATKKPEKKEAEPMEARSPVVAARPKGGARGPRAGTAVSAPAKAARAPAVGAAKTAAVAAKVGPADQDSEYSYTEETEYTDASESEQPQAKAVARPAK